MQFIIDFCDFLINTITTVWDFFVGLLENLMLMFTYIGIIAETCYTSIATFPSWLQAFGTLTIVISTLYIIVGRSAGGKS